MIWDIKYQAGKSPQITQFNKSSKEVTSTELQGSSRVPVQTLPAASSRCYFTPHWHWEIPPKSHLCERGCRQPEVCSSRQICFTCLTKDNKWIHSLEAVFGHQERHPKKNHKLYYLYHCWALLQPPLRKTNKILYPQISILHRYFISGLLLLMI